MEIKQCVNNEGLARGNARRLIVLHHTGGVGRDWDGDGTVSEADLRAYDSANREYLNRTDYVSVHYFVGTDGVVVQLVDDERVAYHCGVSALGGVEGKNGSLNWCSLGVEVNSEGVIFSQEQRESVRELVVDLMVRYGIGADGVVRHKDIAPGRKWDIGDDFWKEEYGSWEAYREMLGRARAEREREGVSEWARGAVGKCVERGVAVEWGDPREVVGGAVLELMLHRVGLVGEVSGVGLTKERLAVVLDRLGLL